MTDGAKGADASHAVLEPEEGEELGRLLSQLGIDRRPARILGHLASHGPARSADLEEGLDMRQPEVSQATKALRERGWVVAEPEKTPGKGRPVNVYSLATALEDVVNEVEAARRAEINRELARIDRLRSLVAAQPEAEAPREHERPVRQEGAPEARKG